MSLSQDKRNERILRELIQQPGNRRCMDCTAKGTVAAVINFGTFVCQTCSGIHREFGHRIKMISMATFKQEEIDKLKKIGNANARKIWLAKWTPSDFPEPDATKQKQIREFMRLKYVEKKWYDAKAAEAIENGTAPAESSGDQSLPKSQPLENILGPQIPSVQVSQVKTPVGITPPSDTSRGRRSSSSRLPAPPEQQTGSNLVGSGAIAAANPAPASSETHLIHCSEILLLLSSLSSSYSNKVLVLICLAVSLLQTACKQNRKRKMTSWLCSLHSLDLNQVMEVA